MLNQLGSWYLRFCSPANKTWVLENPEEGWQITWELLYGSKSVLQETVQEQRLGTWATAEEQTEERDWACFGGEYMCKHHYYRDQRKNRDLFKSNHFGWWSDQVSKANAELVYNFLLNSTLI